MGVLACKSIPFRRRSFAGRKKECGLARPHRYAGEQHVARNPSFPCRAHTSAAPSSCKRISFRRRMKGALPCKVMPLRRRGAVLHEFPAPPCHSKPLLHPLARRKNPSIFLSRFFEGNWYKWQIQPTTPSKNHGNDETAANHRDKWDAGSAKFHA